MFQGAFRVLPTPKIRQEFRSSMPSGRRGANTSNLIPSPQARLSPLPAANAKQRRSNEDKKVDGLKTYGSVYLFMSIITSNVISNVTTNLQTVTRHSTGLMQQRNLQSSQVDLSPKSEIFNGFLTA